MDKEKKKEDRYFLFGFFNSHDHFNGGVFALAIALCVMSVYI